MSNSTQKLAEKWRTAKDWTSRMRFEGLDNYIRGPIAIPV